MWFERLTGFREESAEQVREKLILSGDSFTSTVNQRKLAFGQLEIASLEQLRLKVLQRKIPSGKIKISEVVADVQQLHCQVENVNALFQAASQFNLLEMVGPHVTPEQGIDRYEHDHTQGPACAIACGAGTIYRNYFVPLKDQIGQNSNQQIDCLDLIGKALNNEELQLWTMKNGYALANREGLKTINEKLSKFTEAEREALKGKLKVGIQWNCEVTISADQQRVSQIYCSALPVAYSQVEPYYWEAFSRLILEAAYEATLHTATINMVDYNSNIVYLTLVGGGAFGNAEQWILESLQQAIRKFEHIPLDVRVVSYGQSNNQLMECLSAM
jgi:hypothetical protein